MRGYQNDLIMFRDYFILMPFAAIFLVGIAWTIEEYMYKKKFGPSLTGDRCPVYGGRLRDFEVFNGHCVHCTDKENCKKQIKEQWSKDNTSAKEISGRGTTTGDQA